MAIHKDVKALIEFSGRVLRDGMLLEYNRKDGDVSGATIKKATLQQAEAIGLVGGLVEKAGHAEPALGPQCTGVRDALVNAINSPAELGPLDVAIRELRDAADIASWTVSSETTQLPALADAPVPTQTGTKAAVVSYLRAMHPQGSHSDPLSCGEIATGSGCCVATASRAIKEVFGDHNMYIAACTNGSAPGKLAKADGDGRSFGTQDNKIIDDNHAG